GDNPTSGPVVVVFPAGMIFVPRDSKYQTMIAIVVYSLSVPPNSTKTANVRAMCAEMSKKEPDESCKFDPAMPSSDGLANVARITSRSRFRGAADQARVWIL